MTERRVGVLVPIKSFTSGKSRLRPTLTPNETIDLTKRLARGVIAACSPYECIVVCDSSDVASFAEHEGASVLFVTGHGLNESVASAYESVADRFDVVIIAHGDLVDPTGIGQFDPPDGVTIVTDRHGLGTNVMSLPVGIDFQFAYGTDSASLHVKEAHRLDQPVTVVTDSPWGHDVDTPDDLEVPRT
jgi:2-phospho-L-lactate guanylyltransferase